jgi:hypothetical protein
MKSLVLLWATTLSLALFVGVSALAASEIEQTRQPLTIDELERLIHTRHILTVEKFIEELPLEYRRSYALMFKSRSLHDSSFRNPRVLLYGNDGHLVVSFNGDSSQRAFHAVEIMQFDQELKTFQFAEFKFPKTIGTDSQAQAQSHAPSQAQSHSSVSIDLKPQSCLKCHGQTPHPIWDSYPAWPGAYGERYGHSLSKQETSGLRSFLLNQPKHPRYTWLLDLERWTDPSTFNPSSHDRYNALLRRPPNVELGEFLQKFNQEKIINEIFQAPTFENRKYLFLAALADHCVSLDTDLGTDVSADVGTDLGTDLRTQTGKEATTITVNRDGNTALTFSTYAAKAHAEIALHQNDLLSRMAESKDESLSSLGFLSAGEDDHWIAFRYAVEKVLAIPTREWPISLEGDWASPSAAGVSVTDIEQAVFNRVAASDSQLEAFRLLRHGADSGQKRYCAFLRSPTKRETQTQTFAPAAPSRASQRLPAASELTSPALPLHILNPGQPKSLARCISCHDDPAVTIGPAIPFTDERRLRASFSRQVSSGRMLFDEILFRLSPLAGNQRMPMGAELTPKESNELKTYLEKLRNSPPPARPSNEAELFASGKLIVRVSFDHR